MYTIEFEADIENGLIKIPSRYELFNSKHIKVVAQIDGFETKKTPKERHIEEMLYSDEYIKEHWRELIMTGLSNYDRDYYKSDQYKEDRGAYLMEKYK